MGSQFRRDVEELDNTIKVCFGRPRGRELPQVATEDDIIIDLMSECSGHSRVFSDAQFHHQMEY